MSEKHISIRPLEEKEFTTFVEFQTEAMVNAGEEYSSDYESYQALSMLDKEQLFEKLLNYPFEFVFGAFDETGRLIGMAGFTTRFNRPKQRHKGYLWGIYVSSEYRGMGIASQLVQDILTVAKEDAGCEQILARVSSTNSDGQQLLQKNGFLQYGQELRAFKLDNGTYVDETLMVCML